MRVCWLCLVLLLSIFPLKAQEDGVGVMRHFTVEAPVGYVNTYTNVHWSPTSVYVVLSFDVLDEGQRSVQRLWQLYDVPTGNLLYRFDDFIAWYADGSRALVREHHSPDLVIFDLASGQAVASLPNDGMLFYDPLVTHMIMSLDDAQTLRIYDDADGHLRLSLQGVVDLPLIAPDGSRFAVNILEVGLQVYDAFDLSLLYDLEAYQTLPRHEQVWNLQGDQLLVIPLEGFLRTLGPYHIWTMDRPLLSAPIYNVTGDIVWSPEGDQIAVISDFTKIRLYDSVTGELVQTIRSLADGPITGLSWRGRYLVARNSNNILEPPMSLSTWDFAQGRFIWEYTVDLGYDYWISDDRMVIFEPFLGMTEIELETGLTTYQEVFEMLLRHISPDRRWIIGSQPSFVPDHPETIDVYQFRPLQQIVQLEAHTEIVRFVQWSSDSRCFVSVGGPNTVILWKVLAEG